MAITHIDFNTATVDGSATASITIDIHAGVLEGDVVIAAADTGGGNQNRNMQESSGTWTPVADLFADDNIACNLGVFLKVMGAVPDTSVTIELAVGTGQWSGLVMVFRGVDNTTPQDVAATTDVGANSPDAAPPPITTASDDCEIIVIGAASENSGTVTFPANYVNTIDVPGSANNNRTMAASRSQATAGTETPGTFNVSTSTTTDSWAAVTIALRPATTGRTGTMAATETGADDATAAGTMAIAGSLAVAETGTDTAVLSGTMAITGTAAATETGSDAFAGAGTSEAVSQRNRGGGVGRRIKRETYHKRGKTLHELFKARATSTAPVEPPLPDVPPAPQPSTVFPVETLAPDLTPLLDGLESLRASVAAAALAQAARAAEQAIEADDVEVLMVAL